MIEVKVLRGDDLVQALPNVAELRITVFRDWPYLYDGSLDYERDYLQSYIESKGAIVVGAYDQGKLIGASTGTPMLDHADEFADAFAGTDLDLARVFYCAESVLLPQYRGRGIGHQFFDRREAHARALGYDFSAFCAVQRPVDHPLRPATYVPLDGFWTKRGYAPVDGAIAQFDWKDIDQSDSTKKPLQFWLRRL